jgi:hypothetical protein
MHRFRAAEIPPSPSSDTATLLERVRRGGVVLIADDCELRVIERRRGQLHPHVLRSLAEGAGAVIATLRGEQPA